MSVAAKFSNLALRGGVVVAAALALALPVPGQAQGDLLVAPTRVILNGGGSTQVILNNIGSNTATYRISLELRRMTAEGNLEDVEEANANEHEHAALDMVRYAPRRITLPPNQPQAVRISARPGMELPDGEYRVHMAFRAIPDATPVEEQAISQQSGGLTIKLTPIYGVTIPVIIRKGQLEAVAALSNPRIVHQSGQDLFEVELDRSGERSVYGEIVVKAANGETVANARGVAVYAELGKRAFSMPLNAEQLARLKGKVRVEYREMPENGGKLLAALDTNLG